MPRPPKRHADRNLYELPGGGFQVRLTVRDPATGAPRRLSRRAPTRAAARALRDQLERDHAAGALRLAAERLTLDDWLAEWMETAVVGHRSPGTVRSRRVVVEAHIGPALGRLTLAALTPRHVQAWVAAMLKAGAAPSTVVQRLAVLKTALNHAVSMDLIAKSPAAPVRPPPARQERPVVLTAEQARALLALCERTDRRLAALVAVGVGLGLRRGEALGLRWRDVDLEAGVVRVAVQQTAHEKGPLVQDAPLKTPGSGRTLPLPGPVARVLSRWRAEQAAHHAVVGLAPAALVFTTATGRGIRPCTVTEQLDRALVAARLPDVTYHQLRHSAASMLAALGVHPAVAARLLGHSRVGTTLDVYTHVAADQLADAAGLVGGALTPTATPIGGAPPGAGASGGTDDGR